MVHVAEDADDGCPDSALCCHIRPPSYVLGEKVKYYYPHHHKPAIPLLPHRASLGEHER